MKTNVIRICRTMLALGVVAASGCDSSDGSQRVPDQPVGPRTTRPAATAGGTGSYQDEDLPVPPDFEAEADEQITEENYEEKLAEIEEEMGVKADAGADAGSKVDAGSPRDGGPTTSPATAPSAPAKPPAKPPGAKPPAQPPGGHPYD